MFAEDHGRIWYNFIKFGSKTACFSGCTPPPQVVVQTLRLCDHLVILVNQARTLLVTR